MLDLFSPRNSAIKIFSSIALAATVLFQCSTIEKEEQVVTDLEADPLIPLPSQITADHGSFSLSGNMAIVTEPSGGDQAVKDAYTDLFGNFSTETVTTGNEASHEAKNIFLTKSDEIAEEGYRLTIQPDRIEVEASGSAGFYYAAQTLHQLADIHRGQGILPTGVIDDKPEYSYRGVMLDVARHFHPVATVEELIEQISYYKMNYLHLHLTDDQGWRIEIKSWPRLTEYGGSLEVGGGEGGFYTQEEYKEIVQFASNHFVTVVPEVDMPSHTNAALASYPELNCNGKSPELYTGIKVGFSTLCTDQTITYTFIDDVIRELSQLTPGPYIHMGGDESHATAMEDYIPFVNKVQGIIEKHGKTAIGWDEIANGTLEEGNVAQFWAKSENALLAVGQNARVLMSPAHKTYMDMKYDSTTALGLKWAGYIEIDSAYAWSPETLVPGIEKEDILGVEAPLWTETITNQDEIEYMVFPRLPGYAEIGWTASSKRNWDSYRSRLAQHGPIMNNKGIKFYPSALVDWPGGN